MEKRTRGGKIKIKTEIKTGGRRRYRREKYSDYRNSESRGNEMGLPLMENREGSLGKYEIKDGKEKDISNECLFEFTFDTYCFTWI
jgi:hypothetical protein